MQLSIIFSVTRELHIKLALTESRTSLVLLNTMQSCTILYLKHFAQRLFSNFFFRTIFLVIENHFFLPDARGRLCGSLHREV
jgi:hypothetical protein